MFRRFFTLVMGIAAMVTSSYEVLDLLSVVVGME